MEYELREIMYCVGVLFRGNIAWDMLWKNFKMPNMKEKDKEALIKGMSCAKDGWILNR